MISVKKIADRKIKLSCTSKISLTVIADIYVQVKKEQAERVSFSNFQQLIKEPTNEPIKELIKEDVVEENASEFICYNKIPLGSWHIKDKEIRVLHYHRTVFLSWINRQQINGYDKFISYKKETFDLPHDYEHDSLNWKRNGCNFEFYWHVKSRKSKPMTGFTHFTNLPAKNQHITNIPIIKKHSPKPPKNGPISHLSPGGKDVNFDRDHHTRIRSEDKRGRHFSLLMVGGRKYKLPIRPDAEIIERSAINPKKMDRETFEKFTDALAKNETDWNADT